MSSSPSGSVYFPSILLAIPRNPVTALGLPLALGSINAIKTTSFVRAEWFQVGCDSGKTSGSFKLILPELNDATIRPTEGGRSICVVNSLPVYVVTLHCLSRR